MLRWVTLLAIASWAMACGRIDFESSPGPDVGAGAESGLPDSGSGADSSSGIDSGPIADSGGGPDSSRDSGPETDSGIMEIDSGPPPPLGPFGPPSLVAGVESATGQDDPTLSADELLIIFQRGPDLWSAERGALTEAFAAPSVIAELSSAMDETTPELSSDGLTLYFSRDLGAGADDEIFVSVRGTRREPWGAPTLVAEFSSPLSEVAPTPTANPNVLLFARNFGAGATREDIFRATRPSPGATWTFAALASPINTAAADTAPFLGTSGTLYFSTDRATSAREIWMAAPDTASIGVWLAPAPITELNDTFGVTDPWVSPDERRIYYVTNEVGRDQIYVRAR